MAVQPTPTVEPSPIPGMQTQPVITVTTITSLVSALFAAAVYVWPDLDPDAEKALIAVIVAVWPVVTAAWTYRRVFAPATVNRIAVQQYAAGTPPTEPPPPIPAPPGNA